MLEFISRAEEHWRFAQTLYRTRKPECGHPIREPLQLLVGALIYHRRALRAFDDETLHEVVRNAPSAFEHTIARQPAELITLEIESDKMHLTSAALRPPVAILETIEANPVAASEFAEFIDSATQYWKDSAVLSQVGRPDGCEAGELGTRRALAMVMLVRDDFVHGEVAKGKNKKSEREQQLTDAHRCRLIEAEQCLIRWCLKMLEAVA